MKYAWDFSVVWSYRDAFLHGALVTLEASLLAFGLGMALGLLIGVGKLSKRALVRMPAVCYVEVFRATPVLVQLIWLYYVLPIMLGISLTSFAAGVLALSLTASAFLAEVLRAGIESIDRGQMDAARSVGMTYTQAMRRIILPQAVRRMVPPLINEFAQTVKLSALLSVLSVFELLYQANNLITHTFRPLEVYTTVAVVYFVLIYPVIFLSERLERSWLNV